MSILTADFSEIIEERQREEEKKDRPLAKKSNSRWQEIEALKDARELADLDPLGEFGNLWE